MGTLFNTPGFGISGIGSCAGLVLLVLSVLLMKRTAITSHQVFLKTFVWGVVGSLCYLLSALYEQYSLTGMTTQLFSYKVVFWMAFFLLMASSWVTVAVRKKIYL